MSYIDNGEDEVDYGEAEDQNASAIAFHASEHASSHTEDDEMLQEEGYEDLYDDVDIGFFEPSAEVSKHKDILDAGIGFGHGFREEEEVPYASVGGFSAGSAQYSHQQNVKTENQSSDALEKQAESFPSTIAKEEASVFHGGDEHKQFSRAAEMAGTTRPQVTLTLEAKPKVASPAMTISINQARSMDEKDQDMAGIYVQTSRPLKAKDENDSTHTGLEYKAPPAVIYPPQERGLTGNGIAVAEPLAGLGLVGNDEEYNKITAADNIGAGKMVDSDNDRIRDVGNTDRNYAVDGKASQGGGNRDSVAAAAVNDYTGKHNGQSNGGGSSTMLFVGELQWWTTDTELETALSEFGVLKNLKFFEERASGKSKGYCQVEFYDRSAALACKEGMNGRKFHGRPCLVAFANPRTIMQMGTAQVDKAQAQLRAQQAQMQSRRTMNDGGGNARGASAYQGGDNTRGYGRLNVGVSRGGHGQTVTGRGPTRGRTNVGNKGMSGNGGSVTGVAPYGQGLVGPMGSHPSGMIMPQAMMGQGYDPGYGPPRGGAGYGGYVLPGPPFTGMVQPFPTMGPGTLAGVAPHVNPAFFGRNTTTNGMGMMAGNGIDGSPAGLWGDANMNGWGPDEHDRRGREASYGDEMGDSDYTYSNELAYEKSRGAEELDRADAEWPQRRRHSEREGYRDQRERDREGEKDDWEREKPGRTRNKGRTVAEEEEKEDQRLRSREEDYGKRRRLGTER